MKKVIKTAAIFLTYITFAFGFGYPPPPPPFVSAEISGPPHQAPLFLTDTNRVTIYTQFPLFTPSTVNGNINVEGTYRSSINDPENKNLVWDISTASYNFGIDIKTWEQVTFFATLKINSTGKRMAVTGTDFGMGFLISSENDIRARLDLGLTYHSLDVKVNLRSEPYWYRKHNENKNGLNPFLSVTLNSAFEDWLINPFFQVSFCNQTLFNITGYSRDVYSRLDLYTITPGITYRISQNVMIIAGGNCFIPSGLFNRSSQFIFSSFAQFNFQL